MVEVMVLKSWMACEVWLEPPAPDTKGQPVGVGGIVRPAGCAGASASGAAVVSGGWPSSARAAGARAPGATAPSDSDSKASRRKLVRMSFIARLPRQAGG